MVACHFVIQIRLSYCVTLSGCHPN